MSAPRIHLPEPEEMTGRQREVYDAIVSGPRGKVIGPLRAVLVSPDLADTWQKFGQRLRFDTSLDPRVSELAIIVCARHWNSQVEWQVHAKAAEVAGVPRPVIDAIGRAELPDCDPADGLIYEFARQLIGAGDIDPALHAQAVEALGEVRVVELTAVIGYYSMVSMMLNAQAIPPLEGEALLPPLPQSHGRAAVTPQPAWPAASRS